MKTLNVPGQIGGNHYGQGLQPWDLQRDMPSSDDVFLDARRTDVLEYVFRLKGGLPGMRQDALKAIHNLQAMVARIDELEPQPMQVMAMEAPPKSYQIQVRDWLHEIWGNEIATDKLERCFRFFEESAELVQSLGMTYKQALDLITYVWNRPIGEPEQEVGGVFVTLYALCCASYIDGKECAYKELERIKQPHIMRKIRDKHFSKPVDIVSSIPGDGIHKGGVIPTLWEYVANGKPQWIIDAEKEKALQAGDEIAPGVRVLHAAGVTDMIATHAGNGHWIDNGSEGKCIRCGGTDINTPCPGKPILIPVGPGPISYMP